MLIYSCCSDSIITEAGGHGLLLYQLDGVMMVGWLVSVCKVNNTAWQCN